MKDLFSEHTRNLLCIYEKSKSIEEYCISHDLNLDLSYLQKHLDPVVMLHKHRFISEFICNDYGIYVVCLISYIISYAYQYFMYDAIDIFSIFYLSIGICFLYMGIGLYLFNILQWLKYTSLWNAYNHRE